MNWYARLKAASIDPIQEPAVVPQQKIKPKKKGLWVNRTDPTGKIRPKKGRK